MVKPDGAGDGRPPIDDATGQSADASRWRSANATIEVAVGSPTGGGHPRNSVGNLFGDDLEVDELRAAEAGGDRNVGRVAPVAIRIRPILGVLWRASKVYQCPPR